MATIRRISVGSAAKIGAITTGIVFAFFGCIGVGVSSVLGVGMLGLVPGADRGNAAGGLGVGLVGGLIFLVIGIVVYMIFAAILYALSAFVYNLSAGWVGGLEVEISGVTPTTTVNPALPPAPGYGALPPAQ